MPRPVESASLFPSKGKFIAGGDDMWVRLFDFDTGDEIGKSFVSGSGISSSCAIYRSSCIFLSELADATSRCLAGHLYIDTVDHCQLLLSL